VKNDNASSEPKGQELVYSARVSLDRSFDFLMELCSPHGSEIIDDLKRRDELPEWNDPVPMIRRHL